MDSLPGAITMYLARILEIQTERERRSGSRREVHLISDCALPGSADERALIADISTSGMRLKTAANLPAGQLISFTLAPEVVVSGEVMWSRDVDHGIQFDEELTPAMMAAVVLSSANDAPATPPVPARQKREPVGLERASPARVLQNLVDTELAQLPPMVAGRSARHSEPEIGDRDLFWIVPGAALMAVWYAVVDGWFFLLQAFSRKR